NNSNVKSYIIRARKKYLKLGYANQNDSNYFSLQLLEKFPDLAKSLAVKFPFLIIDEAQDTSEIQMQIIEKLIDNGLEEIMLVGDPDQALYEWNEARPDFLEEKFNNWKENSISLNENRRSSQIVCDFTFNLSTLPQASTAVNKDVEDFNYNPNIVTYDENDIKKTITEFLNNCRGNGIQISQENIAILSRSQSFVNEILGMKNILPKDIPWKPKVSFVKEFALAKYLIDNQQFNKGYKLLERATYKALSDSHYCSQEDLKNLISSYGIIEFRSNIHFLAQILPSTDQVTIKNWIQSSNEVLKKNNIQITLEIKPTKGNIYFDDLFKTAKENKLELNFRLGTVHSVKGETFEAVLLFLKKKGIGSYYKTMLKKGATTSDEEELRIVYVAMTRPRRLLTIAVPDEENLTAWKKRLLSD
ncbi:MAG: UvrD-helicase domain-containing protein, partial [Candidatus Paceibacterota bacterium]